MIGAAAPPEMRSPGMVDAASGSKDAGVSDEPARRKTEDRFRQVVEAAPNAMVMIDASGRIEMVNAQTERVFGYGRADLLGQKIEILLPERFRIHHPNLRDSFFLDPDSRPMGVGRELFGRHRNGSEFPVEIGLSPIETDGGAMVLSAIVDISERKRQEERFRLVVEAAPNAMVMINAAGRIEMVNTQAERVFGYERADLVGQPVEMLVPKRFRAHHPGLRDAFFTDPRPRPMGAGRDLYGLRRDGSEFPVEIGLNPIETEDGTMVLSVIVDISDRKQKEARLLKLIGEKDVLLSEIHHRVKNNLQVIHSLLDLQSTRISDPAMLDVLRDSQNRIRSMGHIHQTLYQSQDFAEVDFGQFLDVLIPTLIASYGIDGNEISLAIKAEQVHLPLDAAVPCGLAVNELIANALKHAFPRGRGGEIQVSLTHDADRNVILSVSDNGTGLPDEVDMVNPATLGLQLVTLLADQLGGSVSVRRIDPTRFILKFPLGPSAGEPR
jgi:PAS domain S-box-containing protein